MPEKKVLIIAYYWPPSGGSGVQRWLKFVKYLPQFGWKPYVFTPENPSVTLKDESLLKDVPAEAEIVKIPIWEPYEVFGRLSRIFSGGKKNAAQPDFVDAKQASFFADLSIWIRGNVLIPDPRKFWVRPATRFLKKYLAQHNIHTIVTTGPPHSMHLIGLALKKRNPSLRWIVDMRDPWSEWGLLESLKLSKGSLRKHKALERKVLARADKVITVTSTWVKQFEKISGRQVELITNGYDQDDFARFTIRPQSTFVIRHVGIVNDRCNPGPFMDVVEKLCRRDDVFRNNIRIEFVGQVDPAFIDTVTSRPILNEITKFTPTVPHAEIIDIYSSSSALLLVLTGYKDPEAYLPGKLFEYLATGLPVIGIGPATGDAARLLKISDAGEMTDEGWEIEDMLLSVYRNWQTGLTRQKRDNAVDYSRKAITARLVEIL
jgi:glycosyltransferase involved in cell wall biosynthesis